MGRKAKVKKQKLCTSKVVENSDDDDISDAESLEESTEVSKSLYTSSVDLFLPEQQVNLENDQENYRFYDLNCDKVMLLLINPCTLHFYGAVSIKCLAGKADIFGYHINSSKPEVQMYSCEGSSALYISTLEEENNDEDDINISIISSLGLSFMEATKICNSVKSGGCVLLFGYPERKEHLRKRLGRADKRFGLSLDAPNRRISNKISIPPEIQLEITNGITVLCGGRGVGKSTSLRYLINRSLRKTNKLLYIDLDIGQPEFTLQECVSAVVINEPVLGPSYTHFRKPFLSYNVGNIDASRCVETYLKAVELLIEKCRLSFSDLPWLVNTMGFNKGVGIYITCSCLAIINPNVVIQIDGSKKQNFPTDLTPSYVTSSCDRNVSKYNLLKCVKTFNSNKSISHASTHSNKQIRWISTECYFNDSTRPSFPIECPVKHLKIFNVVSKTVIPVENYPLLVSKIVILSSSNSVEDPPIALDYGVILSFVESDGIIMILTPLEKYCDIKSILVGSLEIPSRLNKVVNASTSGLIPYCSLSSSGKTAPTVKPIRRTYRFLFEPSFTPQSEQELPAKT